MKKGKTVERNDQDFPSINISDRYETSM